MIGAYIYHGRIAARWGAREGGLNLGCEEGSKQQKQLKQVEGELEERLVSINPVSKTVKGGRKRSSVLVVV